MKHDEFAFANQQLAAMLREGIPLEGALLRLAKEMGRGAHRTALLAVESELRKGHSFETAAHNARLPAFYCEMIRLGIRSGDLPGALTLAADYYRQVGAIWARLRALLTYPLLVLLVSLAMSVWFAFLYRGLDADLSSHLKLSGVFMTGRGVEFIERHKDWGPNLWAPPVLMSAAALLLGLVLASRRVRSRLRWRLGPFQEASLAQLASALHLLLRQGLTLREALDFAARLEPSGRIGRDLQLWTERHAAGHARFSAIASGSTVVPSLFIWIVSSADEKVAEGFAQAAEIYGERARRRSERMLNLVLPGTLLALGIMILGQIQPYMTSTFDVFTPIFQANEIVGR